MRNKNARIPDPNKFESNPGTVFEKRYSSKVNDDGTITLTESGKVNIKEYINSFKESTDMAFIIKQLEIGNTSVLNQSPGVFGDFTEMPRNMMDMHQRILDGEQAFLSLPIEVRNKYNHDVWSWLKDAGTEKWMDIMKEFMQPKETPIVNSSVTSEVREENA